MKIRKAFWRALKLCKLNRQVHSSPSGQLRLVVGADGTHYTGWVHTDIDIHNILRAEEWAALFQPATLHTILAEHVWEHLTLEQGAVAARLCLLYLKPGGRLRIAVPDGLHPIPSYLESVRPGGNGPGAEDHKVLYDYRSLGTMLAAVGFGVFPLEHYDEQGEFHFQEWDPQDGMVSRSSRFDERNQHGELNYTSLIMDALKSQ